MVDNPEKSSPNEDGQINNDWESLNEPEDPGQIEQAPEEPNQPNTPSTPEQSDKPEPVTRHDEPSKAEKRDVQKYYLPDGTMVYCTPDEFNKEMRDYLDLISH